MIEFSNYIKKNSLIDRFIRFLTSIFFVSIRSILKLNAIKDHNIIVISLHKLGDTVFTVPSIKALKRRFDVDITIVCYEDSKKIYDLIFNDLKTLFLKKEDFHLNGRIANSAGRGKVKKCHAGTIIDLTGGINSASLIFNNRAKKIVGFGDGYFKNIYSDYIPKRNTPHLMDMYLDVVKLLIKVDNDNELKYFGKHINKEGYILIHPFAGWKAKEWNFNNFVNLYCLISDTHKCKFILPENRIDEEKQSLLKSKDINVIISNQISDMIDVIKGASIVIGCDSGAVYIASLLGIPTFTIYGPTNPRFSLPYGEHHEYIFKENEYSPKYNEQYGPGDAGRKDSTYKIIDSITVEEVMDRIYLFYKKNFGNINRTD